MPGCSYAAVHIGDLRSHVKKCKKALGSAKRQAIRGVDGRPMARPAAEMPPPDSLSQLLGLIDLLPRPTGQAPDLAPAPVAVAAGRRRPSRRHSYVTSPAPRATTPTRASAPASASTSGGSAPRGAKRGAPTTSTTAWPLHTLPYMFATSQWYVPARAVTSVAPPSSVRK